MFGHTCARGKSKGFKTWLGMGGRMDAVLESSSGESSSSRRLPLLSGDEVGTKKSTVSLQRSRVTP